MSQYPKTNKLEHPTFLQCWIRQHYVTKLTALTHYTIYQLWLYQNNIHWIHITSKSTIASYPLEQEIWEMRWLIVVRFQCKLPVICWGSQIQFFLVLQLYHDILFEWQAYDILYYLVVHTIHCTRFTMLSESL